MKKLLNLFMLLFLGAGFCSAAVFHLQNLRPYELSHIQALDRTNGKPLWRATLERIKEKDSLKLIETGHGIYGKEGEYIKWKTVSYCLLTPGLRPYHSHKVVRDKNGRMLFEVNLWFDKKQNKILYKKSLASGKAEEKEFELKEGSLDRLSLGLALSSFPFGEDNEVKFHVLTETPQLMGVTVKYRGIDYIQTGAGEFYCHKLELVPDLGILSIFSTFVPKTYFWYKQEQPHDFIKYDGLESGLGTPHVILERLYEE